jgi:uncharacterized protein YydD (DUF2326 family)
MLISLTSNDPRFKAIRFQPGLNLVLADKTKKSSRKDTRNGLGKTTLIEIIHFCLGADFTKLKTLKAPELRNWEFSLEVNIASRYVRITRSLEVPGKIVLRGDVSTLPFVQTSTDTEGAFVISDYQWTSLLGHLYFDLPIQENLTITKYRPSFRALISYFMRRSPDSYLDPFRHFDRQPEVDKQVCNTYLLGLNYEHARDFQLLKDKAEEIKSRKRQAETGNLPGVQGSLGELEARRVPLKEQIDREAAALAAFQINPQYREIERESASLTKQLHELSEANIHDQRLHQFYESSLETEVYVEGPELLSMYKQLGLDLPTFVKKRFEDVQQFHKLLLTNRRAFLQEEIDRLQQTVVDRNREKDGLIARRAKLMEILRTQGALDEYSQLQDKVNELAATLKAIDRQIALIVDIDKERSDLQIAKELLFQKATLDFQERGTIRQRAISLFNENSKALYNRPGELIIQLDKKTGYKFGIEIERSPSEGVGHMKVLCYDLTIQQLARERSKGPDFLFHDSTLYDGVDERQVALALSLMANQATVRNFQYVVAMNSDDLPVRELPKNFDLQGQVVCRLTDLGESGGLLGFRLTSTEKSAAKSAGEEDFEVDQQSPNIED